MQVWIPPTKGRRVMLINLFLPHQILVWCLEEKQYAPLELLTKTRWVRRFQWLTHLNIEACSLKIRCFLLKSFSWYMLWQWAWNEWSQTSPTWRSRWYLRTLCIGTTSRSLSVNFPLLALFEHSWNKHNTHIYNSRSYNASYKGITYMSVFVVTDTFSQGSINQSKASKECVVFLIYYCRIKIITRGRYETRYVYMGVCIQYMRTADGCPTSSFRRTSSFSLQMRSKTAMAISTWLQ